MILQKWKYMFVQYANSILAIGKYIMYGDIKISQKNTIAVVVCLLCLEDKTSIEWVMW